MADSDLKSHALNASTDFYDLLGLPPTASDSDIRRAYRKTALKYHPDKVGANNVAARQKFDLLQIANDVLSDPAVRELYDNARRAKEEKKERDALFEGRRKGLKEDLERRESGALKRKREVVREEEEFERELRRLAEDGKRRRREREEVLRREAQAEEEEREGEAVPNAPAESAQSAGPTELDRSITLRYSASAASQIDKDALVRQWERFGPLQDCVLREKKVKKDGEKHKQPYMVAILVYKSIVGAHAAVSDIQKLQQSHPDRWSVFEAVGWAGGKEPDHIPKHAAPVPQSVPDDLRVRSDASAPSTPQRSGGADDPGLRKAPSFASFKGTPGGATPKGPNSPSLDEITMIRLKNAERRRMEEKIRKEEAAAAAEA